MRKPIEKAFLTYQSKVNERLAALKHAYTVMRQAAQDCNRAALTHSAEAFISSAKALQEILPAEDWPGWLSAMRHHAARLVASQKELKLVNTLVQMINKNEQIVSDYHWAYRPEEEGFPDISSILSDEMDEKGINDCFQKIIDVLSELAGSPNLDHDKAHSDLLTVLAMLKKARSEGYAEKIFTWNFVRRYVPNLLLEFAKSTALLAQCITAFEKTASELDISFEQMKNDVSKRFYDEVGRTMRTLPNDVSPIPLLPSSDGASERHNAR